MSETVDYVYKWIWQLADMQGVIPPFCVELTLIDGTRVFLHSVPEKNDKTESLILRFWDFRALDEEDIQELKTNLSDSCTMKDQENPKDIHPGLDWADLRLHIQNISYAIEWNDSLWPREERPQFGLIPA
ncbi:MAG: hypothetical protein N2D54_03335 [Chloroflexota bacterium]